MQMSYRIRVGSRWVAVGWAVAIVASSFVPWDYAIGSGLGDKLGHMAAYALLTCSAALGWRDRMQLPIILLAVLTYGATIEALQAWVPGRIADWGDLLANTIGTIAGAGMAVVAARYMDVE